MNVRTPLIAGLATAGVVAAHEVFTRHFEPDKRARAMRLTVQQITGVGLGVGAVAGAVALLKGGPKAAAAAALGGAAMVAGAQLAHLATSRLVHHGDAEQALVPPFFELGKKTNFVASRAMENALAGVPLGAALLHPHIGWTWGAVAGAGVSAVLALGMFHDDFDKRTVDV